MPEIVLHSFEALPSADSGHACVLIRLGASSAVVVWSGMLSGDALTRPADELTEQDFLKLDVHHLRSCDEVWARLRGPRHAALVDDLRHRLRAWPVLGASERNVGPSAPALPMDRFRRERWLALTSAIARSMQLRRVQRAAR